MNFSVIIPCRNAQATILQSVRSAADQSSPPYEIIVVDDGSTDASRQVVESCDIALRLLHISKGNAAGARNVGIEAAKGQWLAFLDADDVWYPDHLSRAERLIRKHRVVGYLNHYDWLSLDGRHITRKRRRINSVVSGFGISDYVELYSQYRHFVGMSACAVEREAACAMGGFDESMIRTEDIEFWLRFTRNRAWLFDPVASSAYRKHTPDSLSSNEASAALYRVIAFAKNQDSIEDLPRFRALMRRLALRALVKAIVLGGQEEQARAHEVAYEYLSGSQRVLYRLVQRTPVLGEFLWKRRLI